MPNSHALCQVFPFRLPYQGALKQVCKWAQSASQHAAELTANTFITLGASAFTGGHRAARRRCAQ